MRPRYKVDLPRQLAQCEANYLRLTKLLPQLDSSDLREFVLPLYKSASDEGVRVMIQVEERARYTTTVLVSHADMPAIDIPGLSPQALLMPELRVRLYHDAAMAEVICWQRHRGIKPRYDYPNEYMHQRDEKAQLNRFLGEWLSFCLEQGHAVQSPIGQLG